ncbi:MAG: hypothetical protein JFAIHJKO_01162 [Pyrinomonadaceae bacterium]|nr:hypothetical protein [Pyrinomonadaceae bacterium]
MTKNILRIFILVLFMATAGVIAAEAQGGTRIVFKRGRSVATVNGTVAQGGPDFWVVGANRGQTMTVKVTGKVSFGMDSPRGQMTEDDSADRSYSFDLDFDGDYTIRVYSKGGVQDYTLTVAIL